MKLIKWNRVHNVGFYYDILLFAVVLNHLTIMKIECRDIYAATLKLRESLVQTVMTLLGNGECCRRLV